MPGMISFGLGNNEPYSVTLVTLPIEIEVTAEAEAVDATVQIEETLVSTVESGAVEIVCSVEEV